MEGVVDSTINMVALTCSNSPWALNTVIHSCFWSALVLYSAITYLEGHLPSCLSTLYSSHSTDQKKVDDAQKAKEIRQLQKESRKRDNKIRTLESDARRRELVLKRRQEEVLLVYSWSSSWYVGGHLEAVYVIGALILEGGMFLVAVFRPVFSILQK